MKEVPRYSTQLVCEMKTNIVVEVFPTWNGDIRQFSHCSKLPSSCKAGLEQKG